MKYPAIIPVRFGDRYWPLKVTYDPNFGRKAVFPERPIPVLETAADRLRGNLRRNGTRSRR